jgi:hypothetical protein
MERIPFETILRLAKGERDCAAVRRMRGVYSAHSDGG